METHLEMELKEQWDAYERGWQRSLLYGSMHERPTTQLTGRRPQCWTMAEDKSCWWRNCMGYDMLFSELELVIDNFPLHLCRSQLRSHWKCMGHYAGGGSQTNCICTVIFTCVICMAWHYVVHNLVMSKTKSQNLNRTYTLCLISMYTGSVIVVNT